MAKFEKGKSMITGVIVGGVMGAACALLFAPKSGRELRAEIAEQYGKITDTTGEWVEKVKTATVDKIGAKFCRKQETAAEESVADELDSANL